MNGKNDLNKLKSYTTELYFYNFTITSRYLN